MNYNRNIMQVKMISCYSNVNFVLNKQIKAVKGKKKEMKAFEFHIHHNHYHNHTNTIIETSAFTYSSLLKDGH